MKNYYSILGIKQDASQQEIKNAFRNLIKKWHPDRCHHVDANIRTEGVSRAYSVLSCPESRYTFDIQLKAAGLSTKPLFFKSKQPCTECDSTGKITTHLHPKSCYDKLAKFLGKETPYTVSICLSCCGTGWEQIIKEHK